MVLSRASVATGGFARTVLRRTGASARSRAWRQVPRRTYASGHGEQQSSELPWIIGSLVVTVPAAGYLLQQGKSSGGHGHGHDEHEKHEEPADNENASSEGTEEDSEEGTENKDEDKEGEDEGAHSTDESQNDGAEGEAGKDQNNDESKQEDSDGKGQGSKPDKDTSKKQSSDDDQYEKPGPNAPQQINWKPGMGKGPGEGQKGERAPTEKKGEKMARGDFSGAKHPYIDDPEKSKKGVGVTETARIHGTVDTNAPARGVGH